MLPKPIRNLHKRFVQQAKWTFDLRSYLFNRASFAPNQHVLDVGCGTGVILKELEEHQMSSIGVDINDVHLEQAVKITNTSKFSLGDAHFLPFTDNYFDISMCHFLLIWVDKPLRVVEEMVRVTKPGGIVMVLAEPDYGGRIDFPDSLSSLGKWQSQSLEHQGADPYMGRKLAGIFHEVSLNSIETGVLGGQWSNIRDMHSWDLEWQILESDFSYILTQDEIDIIPELKRKDQLAYESGERVLFVPTFYAWGKAN